MYSVKKYSKANKQKKKANVIMEYGVFVIMDPSAGPA